MRASELLGASVRTSDGRRLGVVTGLRCSLDGPSSGPTPAPRVRALVVSGRLAGAALGYQQEGQRGPWLVRALIRALHRHTRLVDVALVDRVEDGTIRLTANPG
ncbi:MAG: PRC-barrel domain-containing protein [Friedmanniella sp.]|jgi:hypothetical protein